MKGPTLKLPPPNLQGDYRGSCLVCLTGTDSGLALAGEAEWVIAGLIVLGIPMDQASALVEAGTGCEPGMSPVDDVDFAIRICSTCAEKSGTGMKAQLLPDILRYSQPMESREDRRSDS